jgi:hypothetical protein
MTPAERALRERLGIPPAAERVIIFGETSHWDPNWLFTSEEYYERRIQHILDAVLEELSAEPRRVFSVESLFFLRLYWQRQPDKCEEIRRLVNERRIRLTGTGLTTPDTLLPATEAILRDYLLGQEWLRENGMDVEPRLAYLPDDFGHSPALPSILRALGYDQVGITRIDGMYFVGTDYRLRSAYPLAGSSAERLERELKTLDFVWRAPDGAEVLCHWNAFSYFQGDMLAHIGIIRWMGTVFGMPWRTGRHIASRISNFVEQLAPLARTPYLFCPIGCDFNGPISHLLDLLDRYNGTRYPQTGVYAVNAGMDDYLDLVDCHRDRLPTLELDPNPYWMGFYASRPEIKLLCNRITRKLETVEKLELAAPCPTCGDGVSPDLELQREIGAAWDLVALSNHHDFITGTAPDRVWLKEQKPWLQQAEVLVDSALERLRPRCPPPPACPACRPPRWRRSGRRLLVEAASYALELDEAAGGCIVSLRTPLGGERLSGPANDLLSYRDSGGLWRMGHEFRGGVFREAARASQQPAKLTARERDGLLEVRVESVLEGRPFVRWLWLRDDSPVLRLRIVGSADRRRTITCRFPALLSAHRLAMDVPGGVLQRPRRKLYDPTFWPARSYVHVREDSTGQGLAAFLGSPACATLGPTGALEWVAARNAPREVAFGVLPLVSHPASGEHPDEHALDYGVWFTTDGDLAQQSLAAVSRRVLGDGWLAPSAPDLEGFVDSLVTTDRHDVLVSAVKTANRGPGVIVRLSTFGGGPGVGIARLRCASRRITAARLCDARERDLRDLPLEDGGVAVPIAGALVSVRLLLA